MSTTLPLFWHLPSASKKERVETSVKLVSALEQFQDQFTQNQAEKSDDEDDSADADQLDALNAHDVSYSIRRLIRGLSSSRESSRLGFAVALTELLSRLENVTAAQIITLICDASQTSGSMTGQEERDALFGRLFGLTAVVQSNLLTRSKPLAASASSLTSPSDLESFKETSSHLKALGDQRSYLRESAWWTICLAVDALNESDVLWKEDAVSFLTQAFIVDDKQWTTEKVALTLKLQAYFPQLDWRSIVAPTLKNPNLLNGGNLPILAKILKESAYTEDDGNSQSKASTVAWKPQLHFAWGIILDYVFDSSAVSDASASQRTFQDFFRVVVDESLFAPTSSAERKYWGFQVFQKALPRVTEADLPMMFTTNFMRTWINHLSHEDRYLHKAARQVVVDIQAAVKRNPRLGFTLLLQLTGVNGSRQFDRLTETKTVESIFTSMDSEGIQEYIDYLQRQMNKEPNDDDQAVQTRQAWAIDQLGSLVRNNSIPKDDTWVQSVLDWLAINGLFTAASTRKKASSSSRVTIIPDLSDDLRATCRARLLGCLADLTAQTSVIKGENKTSKVAAVASDGQSWVARTLKTIADSETNTKRFTLIRDIQEPYSELWSSAKDTLAKVQQHDRNQDTMKGAGLLLSATILQQYCSPDDDIDFEVLQGCLDGVLDMYMERKKSKKSRKSNAASEDPKPEPIDILVDIIIGFMEKSTAYLRAVANQAFALLSASVKESTVDLILAQLERRDPTGHADEDDFDEDEDEGESGSQIDAEEDESSGSGDDDDDDEEEDGQDDEEVDEVRRKIEAALQANGLTGGSGSESEAEELMDDDQMMAIDEQLAAVFRARTQAKKAGKDTNAQREATHFKNRILDLVDTFIRRHPSSPLVPRFVLPLIEVVAGTGSDEQQLSDKAKGILQTRIGKSKELPSNSDVESLTTALEEIHLRVRKGRLSHLLPTLTQCSIYLAKTLLHANASEPVTKTYKASLSDFATRKNSGLSSAFFEDFIRRHPSQGWELRDEILLLSAKAVNVYRRCQTLQLVHVLLSQISTIGPTQADVETFMRSLRETLTQLLSSACDDKTLLSAPQIKELSKLVLQAVRVTVRAAPASAEQIWDPKAWTALHTRLHASERYKNSTGILNTCMQVPRLVGVPESVGERKGQVATKRKGDALDREDRSTKKTKRKPSKKDS
ncbi:hypothetical protein HGRIS_013204 [Hohenbuehelia grisea]|uniref:DNA polymerase V n=1 Tax=Hohenbuehelia grisea TaxID=104357 RepID=A0ABR3IUU4_9AGAR